MFGRKKEPAPPPPRKGGGNKLMAQMGMMDPNDMAAMDAMIYGDDDDAELEAELAMIAGENPSSNKSSPKKGPVSMDALNKMVASSMKDMPDSDDDNDLDVNDPELLAELQMLSTQGGSQSPEPPPPVVVQHATPAPSAGNMAALLEDRLTMYQNAMENAKASGDSSKARRLDRGIKTLRDLLRSARAGRPIAEDDIPPAVSTSAKPTPVSSPMKEQSTFPSPPKIKRPDETMEAEDNSGSAHASPAHIGYGQPTPPQTASPAKVAATPPPGDDRALLVQRKDQYKHSALAAKRSGDETTARRYIKIAKQFEMVITAMDEGKPVDLSQMPPPPPEFGGPTPRAQGQAQGSTGPTPSELANAAKAAAAARSLPSPQDEEMPVPVPEMAVEEKKKLFNAPSEAGTVLEALEQRLEKYRASCLQAKGEENNSKARRMGRIVKQYEDAIKAHKAGKPVDYAELPTPPGFPPIPGPAKIPPPTPSPLLSPSNSNNQLVEQQSQQVSPHKSPRHIAGPAASAPQPTAHPAPAAAARPTIQRQTSILSRAEQQAMFLQERQLAFKRAALKAKQNGDLELAKKYLRQAMGFDQMIEASKSGLPVDMAQVPALPGMGEDKLEFISSTDVKTGDRAETYKSLEQELITQIRTCTTNSEHFTKLGDVSTASKFDKIGVNARKDLESLKNAFKHGDPVPRFHYESRTYTLVKSFADLGDNDLQLTIIRGLNYHLPSDYSPSDLNTYIQYEFPYPNDEPQKGYSDTVKGTNNPEHNQSFTLTVNRKSRSFLRFVKNKSLKVEVYYKRGFFKGDKLLGTANIKLMPLENACELHDSFDLMDGRKAVGGKLEVRLRVREPFLGKQVEEVKEKWLIIDHFDRVLPAGQDGAASSSRGKAPAPPSQCIASIKVLEYEKQLFDRQIQQMAGRLSRSQEEAMRKKSTELGQRTDEQREQLRRGGVNALREYANAIDQSKQMYLQEASALLKQGNREKAQILVTKKKIIEKEVESIRSKLPR